MLLDKHKWGTATKGLLGNSEYVVASMAGFKHIMECALGQQEAQEVSDCSLKAAMRFLDRMESRSKGQIPTPPRLAPAYEARRLRLKDRHPGHSLLKKVFTQVTAADDVRTLKAKLKLLQQGKKVTGRVAASLVGSNGSSPLSTCSSSGR